MVRKILSFVLVGVALLSMVGCGSEIVNNTSSNSSSNNTSGNSIDNLLTTNKKYTLGDTFTFDGLELTLDSNYSFTTIKNRYSEHNGKSVIKLGVNVKNVSSEKHKLNMFYYDVFGSQGVELASVSAYFDNAIDYAGELKPSASYKSNFYFLYDGDGKYSIDFDNYDEELSVEFDITK